MLHHKILKHRIKQLIQPQHLTIAIIEATIWYCFSLWFRTFKILRKNGSSISESEHISKLRQYIDILRLNLLYQIPLHRYYSQQLYLKKNRQQIHWLNFLNTLPYFHDFCNKSTPNLKAQRALLSDKNKFAIALQENGFPCPKTLTLVKNPSQMNLYFQEKDVFCKPISASHNKDAFLLKYDPKGNSYRAFPINGFPVSDAQKLRVFLRSKTSPMMIQEALEDHPDIASFSGTEEITTLRLITGKLPNGKIEVLYLQLEIPKKERHASGQQLYQLYPLQWPHFNTEPHWEKAKSDTIKYDPHLNLPSHIKKLLKDSGNMCKECHSRLFSLQTIAFDLALTAKEPIIIEANYNWNIELLFNVIHDLNNTSPAAQWLKSLV